MMEPPEFTLTAGPTMASHRVLAALGSPIVYDYDPVFLERFRSVERKVAEVYQTENDIVILQGEAVLGLEAAARGLTRDGTTVVNLVSGVYGKWAGLRFERLGARVVEVEVPYNQSVNPTDVETALRSNPDTTLVCFVHSETPSGTLNPAEEIGRIAKEHGALVMADVVSSLGGEELYPDEWGLDICVSGPQKCLGGPSSLSLVSVSDAAWEAMRANPDAPRGSYLSLLDWKERWLDAGRVRYPYTPSVSDMTGLEAACDELLAMGLENSVAMHHRAAQATRSGIKAMGLRLWPDREEIAASCVTAVEAPEEITTADLLHHIRTAYGVMLSPGHGELIDKIIRLGHMGPAARSLYPIVALSALGRGLADFGLTVSTGSGIEAALEVIAKEPIVGDPEN